MIVNEIGIIGHGYNTYYKANKSCDEIIDENTDYNKRLGFKITEKENTTDHPTGVRSSLHLKFALRNKFLNLFPMRLSLYTPKLNIFIKILIKL